MLDSEQLREPTITPIDIINRKVETSFIFLSLINNRYFHGVLYANLD